MINNNNAFVFVISSRTVAYCDSCFLQQLSVCTVAESIAAHCKCGKKCDTHWSDEVLHTILFKSISRFILLACLLPGF